MNIYKDWKAKLESAYSFILKYSEIIVCDSSYVCNLLTSNIVLFAIKLHKCIYFLGIALMFPTSVYFSSVNRSLVDDPNCHGIAQRCDLPVFCPVDSVKWLYTPHWILAYCDFWDWGKFALSELNIHLIQIYSTIMTGDNFT